MPVKKRAIEKRLMEKVNVDANGCWIYGGAIDTTGYGRIGRGGRGEGLAHTHRVTYEMLWGPLRPGQHIDHLCRVRACCNPHHLDAVTQGENNRRSHDAKRGKFVAFYDQFSDRRKVAVA